MHANFPCRILFICHIFKLCASQYFLLGIALNTSCFENDELHINTSYQLENYIFTHFEKMTKITKQYDNFCEKYKNVSWLIDQNVDFNGMTNDFKIKQYFQFMGYNDRYVFIVYIKPQFNELNCNQTLTNAIYDSFIVKNVKKPNEDDTEHIKKNYERFYNKEIVCIVFSTDLDMPYYIDWKNKEGENIIIFVEEIILNILNEKNPILILKRTDYNISGKKNK